MPTRTLLAALALVLLLTPLLLAERPMLGPQNLLAEATHVLVGDVKAVYARAVSSWWRGEEEVITHYLVELEVVALEKGAGYAPKDLAYVRCWQRTKSRRHPTPGPSGHGPIPEAGHRVRVYAAKGEYGPTRQEDNGITAVYPNGFELLSAVKGRHAGEVLSQDEAAGTVVVSLGYEQRVQVGQRLTIARGPAYVGVVEVTSVEAKQSTAQIVEVLQKQPIQVGDRAVSL